MKLPSSSHSRGYRAGIALGSNLGHSLSHLRKATAAILTLSSSSSEPITYSSSIYRTAPVDCPTGSGYFLNAVVEIEWHSGPEALWEKLQRLEFLAGRKKHPRRRHAPRPLDLDLLYLNSYQDSYQGVFGPIILPHPEIGKRRFVLTPLSDFAPHLFLPREKRTVQEQLALLPTIPSVRRIEQTLSFSSRD
ncbi:MAG: 2-amino-4-hydroxy-6-hydroxymethyldihydropteridine diphosphokinase [Candidatus Xiphinematobacter sp.]|nr:MAG: 2-amino-4-hydroxy-6-hydroxymethyldihydropteridine diphosphokinase [Candidatus Xiphinematobacter sp.]